MSSTDVLSADDIYDAVDSAKEMAMFLVDMPAHVVVARTPSVKDATKLMHLINDMFADTEEIWSETTPGHGFDIAVVVRVRLNEEERKEALEKEQSLTEAKYDALFKNVNNLSVLSGKDFLIPKITEKGPGQANLNKLTEDRDWETLFLL